MNVFNYIDYKSYLRAQIAETRGLLTKVAKAAGCGQSFLSQVIGGKPEITPDQAFGITEFFRLSPDEVEYFTLLVQHSRAVTPKLKQFLGGKIKTLQTDHHNISKAIATTNDQEISVMARDFYYSSWFIPAIHILTACPEYQSPPKIAARLNISLNDVNQTLDGLEKRGFIHWRDGCPLHSGKNLHLPTQSLHNQLNHLNWRLRGVQSSTDPLAIHYTSVFAVSTDDWEKIRTKLLGFLEEQRLDIENSGSNGAFVFCCDLFPV